MRKLIYGGLVLLILLSIPAGACTTDDSCGQEQYQEQQQDQDQQQQQSQTVSVQVPQNADGVLIAGNGASGSPTSAKLDIGTVNQSRYMPKGEVLVYEIRPGAIVSVKAASDVGLYSIRGRSDDAERVSSNDATPSYDAIYHRMEWGVVLPVDYIDYWTMDATLPTSEDAFLVVIDNRGPEAMNTHIDISGVTRLYSSPTIKGRAAHA